MMKMPAVLEFVQSFLVPVGYLDRLLENTSEAPCSNGS